MWEEFLHPKTLHYPTAYLIGNNCFQHLHYMSSKDDTPLESEPARDEDTQRTQPGGSRPANIIEFVNSDDPNVRSAIQRHTAYHSAAQRRDARSRLLRRPSQNRYLEWGRRPPRPDTETATTSSASSASISPTRSTSRLRQGHTSSNPTDQGSETSQSRTASITEMDSYQLQPPPVASIVQDDPIIQFCKYYAGIKKYPYCTKTSRCPSPSPTGPTLTTRPIC